VYYVYKNLSLSYHISLNHVVDKSTISTLIDELLQQKNTYLLSIAYKKIISRNSVDLSTVDLDTKTQTIDKLWGELEKYTNIQDLRDEKNFENLMFTTIQSFEEKIVELDNLVQKLYYIIVSEKLRLIDFPIYTAHYYDFRGRLYPNSSVGFTYLKNLRPGYKLPEEIFNSISIQASN